MATGIHYLFRKSDCEIYKTPRFWIYLAADFFFLTTLVVGIVGALGLLGLPPMAGDLIIAGAVVIQGLTLKFQFIFRE